MVPHLTDPHYYFSETTKNRLGFQISSTWETPQKHVVQTPQVPREKKLIVSGKSDVKKEWRSTRWGPNNYLWVGSRTSIYGGYSSRYPFYKAILIIYRLWFQIIRRVRDSPQTSIFCHTSQSQILGISPLKSPPSWATKSSKFAACLVCFFKR